ncbi:protein PLANT CADMIUM RESISTANCE 10 isoform X1 [Spinacia oleracea]|uniref:Protein PLANT CADMIUM RESISTANCE 10 isoform X1 n=1 Tax=Spinacia oleracea TaxID=3562 RepID=A0ABM3R9R3_SPIOL|nr:protein PLANT CADMIUM RESISTANCE 10 isoform X1 [Spinacia oleracea]
MEMIGIGSYVPPPYIPLSQSEEESEALITGNNSVQASASISNGTVQWSSGICACCDDSTSCCIGIFCPCYLFAKNAEFLGSETLVGPCMAHCMLWALASSLSCLYCVLLGLPGCLLSCYACNYRRILRTKYNLPLYLPILLHHSQEFQRRRVEFASTDIYGFFHKEAPCGDFATHLCCHLCALCQEYREICERSGDPNYSDPKLPVITAPPVQKMEASPGE